MNLLLSSIIGYLLGSFMTAVYVSSYKGKNIRQIGSCNPGASNVYVNVGKQYAVIVAFFDMLKGFLACYISSSLFNNDISCIYLAGIFSIIGHIFPIWYKFSGGKGLATLLGVILFIDYKLFIIFGISIIIVTLVTDFIAPATILVTILFLIFIIFKDISIVIKILFFILSLVIISKHIENIKRIINGTEVGLLRKNKRK